MIACIKMFHTLGISVVAEGVETAEQAEVLAKMVLSSYRAIITLNL